MKFHHIGYLVKNLNRYLKLSKLNINDLKSFSDPIQEADLHLVNLPEGYIELIVPWDNSKLDKEIEKKRDGFHHICYITESQDSYKDFISNAIKVSGPHFSVMFECEIEFYYKKGIIIEIVKNYE
jgi:hypothetical protein